MEYVTIILRTLFLYVLIITCFRLMGKREIGELSILDLVVFIMLAEMAVVAIEDPEKSLLTTILPMIVLLTTQIVLAAISLKSEAFRQFLDGKPSILINHGKVDERELKRQRYNLNDLMVQLREKQIKNINDVEFAILEPSGKLSVIEKDENNNGGAENVFFPFPVIMDGKIQEEVLERIGKTNLWLRQELKKMGYNDIKKVSLCTINNNGNISVDIKNEV